LRFNVGPQTNKRLGIVMDYEAEFPGADHDVWLNEYEDSVEAHDPFASRVGWIANEVAEPWSVLGESEEDDLPSEWAAS
jgi:hypothetical protein